MFGYVNVSLNSISEADKKLYSAYYCGLCRAIGKKSQISRLTLSNDLTFLSVMLSALVKNEPVISEGRHCIAHPFKKHCELEFDDVLDYVSDMNILLVYLKICDDAEDDGKITDLLKKRIFVSAAEKAEKKHAEISEAIRFHLKRLSELERNKSPSVDMSADCFAKVLEAVFSPKTLGLSDETLHILKWIGYNIGRWIYIIDAYADIEKDIKSKSYNPFIFAENIDKALTEEGLIHTLAAAANAYDLLDVYRNDSLIRNFLFSGLPEKQEYIFTRTEKTNGSL